MRALSPRELLAKTYDTLQWTDRWIAAFDQPETSGVWFLWGNSANGKSSFVMQLAAELARLCKVLYVSLEEGTGLTLQMSLSRTDLTGIGNNLQFTKCDMEELRERLSKRRSPQVVIIDSFQYTRLSFPQYVQLKEDFPHKLLVFVSHADGKQPSGRTAKAVKYDADLKIWVEGFKAHSNGRYNPGGVFTVWDEGAEKYWGEKEKGKSKGNEDEQVQGNIK